MDKGSGLLIWLLLRVAEERMVTQPLMNLWWKCYLLACVVLFG